jgi:hypothetical protein
MIGNNNAEEVINLKERTLLVKNSIPKILTKCEIFAPRNNQNKFKK